jgi:hypothetical protein
MSGAYCSECGAYALALHLHQCPPKWEVRDADDDESALTIVHEFDAESAASKYAEQSDDQGDGPRERTVSVRRNGGDWQSFDITFEHSITYYAHEQQ